MFDFSAFLEKLLFRDDAKPRPGHDRCRWCVRRYAEVPGGADADFAGLCRECIRGRTRPENYIARLEEESPTELARWIKKQRQPSNAWSPADVEHDLRLEASALELAATRLILEGREPEARAKQAQAREVRAGISAAKAAVEAPFAALKQGENEGGA